MSKVQIEVDCTKKCKSRRHGQILTSAITKRCVTDEALASYIRGTCVNFIQAFDYEGRTALHMAVSRGRKRLMEWLLQHSTEAFANARDRESGYTPLHRSIFYGQIHIAVALIKMGVNIDILDKDDYKALDHATLDRQYMYKYDGHTQQCDVYVWGTNTNYTLGTGNQQQKKTPDMLNCFNRNNISVKQVCLGKFHSVWLCSTNTNVGEVWACGQTGRVGAAVGMNLKPTPLRLPEPCVQVAITLDSTIFLLQSGLLLQYTLNNTDTQIKQTNDKTPSVLKLASIKPLMKLSEAIGVCASRHHGAIWNAHAAYTWGVNVGQLGHSTANDKYVESPKRVSIAMSNPEQSRLQLVVVTDAATIVSSDRGDVYLLHKHACKKIASKQLNLKQLCVDAKINEHGAYSRVMVLFLYNTGQLKIWQDTSNSFTRCVFGYNHQIRVTYITLTHDALFFTTNFGEAFVGTVSRKTASPPPQPIKKEKDTNNKSFVKFLEKNECTSVKITKIPNIHRAVSMSVDVEGLNFACLQLKPASGLTSLPELSPTCFYKHMDGLMETASEDDILHDVTFKVGQKLFPAHIFIIASGSERLHKLYEEQKLSFEDGIPIITLPNENPEVFKRILKYMYTGTCDVMEKGPCSLKISKEELISNVKKENGESVINDEIIDNPMEISAFEVYKNKNDKGKKNKTRPVVQPRPAFCDPVKLVQAAAKRLAVMSLHKALEKFFFKDGIVCRKEDAPLCRLPPWSDASRDELSDTSVCSKDGQLMTAHKCILAARLEYFHGMFMHSWTESNTKSVVTLPINHSILLPVINFLYTDNCPEIVNSDRLDFICSLLVVADQLFISRLREICEIALANLITLKNCNELCQFAHTYNAPQLKQSCMQFISLNMCNFLENKSLEILDDSLLEDITKYYCDFNPIMSSRIITPFSIASDDDIINEYNKLYPVDLEIIDEDFKADNTPDITKKRKPKKIEYTESEKARMRYESVSSVNSLDMSNENIGDITLSLSKISRETEKTPKDKWIEIPTAQQKQQKIVQARLKAISSAKDIPEPQPSFTKLTKIKPPSPDLIASTSRMSVSPKETPLFDFARSPQGSVIITQGPKLSQKQRKKMALQGDMSPSLERSFSNDLNLESPQSPKNPWKISEVPIASCSPLRPKTVEFNQILADQKKQRDDSSRIMTKPLNLTQLEDKAIEELERFYNVHEIDDELISINRIELIVTSPQWVHTTPK